VDTARPDAALASVTDPSPRLVSGAEWPLLHAGDSDIHSAL